MEHLIIILLLMYGAFIGWKRGLMKELASMVGFFVGLVIAHNFYGAFGGSVIAFIGIWIIVPIVLGMVASLVTKALDFTIIGGIFNRILGSVVGVLKWGLLIGCVLWMIDKVEEWKTLLETL